MEDLHCKKDGEAVKEEEEFVAVSVAIERKSVAPRDNCRSGEGEESEESEEILKNLLL